jgi:hypothetical protein
VDLTVDGLLVDGTVDLTVDGLLVDGTVDSTVDRKVGLSVDNMFDSVVIGERGISESL